MLSCNFPTLLFYIKQIVYYHPIIIRTEGGDILFVKHLFPFYTDDACCVCVCVVIPFILDVLDVRLTCERIDDVASVCFVYLIIERLI